ncbi:MAG: kinase [Myxococcota bacterium]
MDRALAMQGPLFGALTAPDWERWEAATAWLERELPAGPTRARRIHWLTVPILEWLLEQRAASPRQPLLVGLSAPQGSGKSTLTALLVALLARSGVRAATLSIDDFYLRREDQLALAAARPDDPFVQHRGYPGTHDLALGTATLRALKHREPCQLPRYDKAAHGGRGDRGASVPAPDDLALVLLEGWMLGFAPVRTPPPELAWENERLAGYRAWTALLDRMIAVRARDPHAVLRWRVEAERVLSRADAEDYARRFLPAYALWGATVRGDLSLTLDEDRLPVR